MAFRGGPNSQTSYHLIEYRANFVLKVGLEERNWGLTSLPPMKSSPDMQNDAMLNIAQVLRAHNQSSRLKFMRNFEIPAA
jgi:aminoglycoside N3'-acetyltransferase